MAANQAKFVPLRIFIDKEKNSVIFAEAGCEFVDILFSFMTIPLGTITRLVSNASHSQPLKIGSLSTLYEGVSNLDEKHFSTTTCKSMLLQPRNSLAAHCRKLKLNIDETEPTKYFGCEGTCRLISVFRNTSCRCGKLMNHEKYPSSSVGSVVVNEGEAFVKESATFIISDSLDVMSNTPGAIIMVLSNLGIQDMNAVEERTVNIDMKKILELLKCSLVSKATLTDVILRNNQLLNLENLEQHYAFQTSINSYWNKNIKALVRKSSRQLLFAQADEGFIDFLFSFLTIPLGGVLHLLDGRSTLGSIDNLYKSIRDLDSNRCIVSWEVKSMLLNPPVAFKFKCNNQILPILEEEHPELYNECGNVRSFLSIIDPKSRGFAKGPSMYMVTDDLTVTSYSSLSVMSFLNRLNIPFCDAEEMDLCIGIKEGMSILKASLTSKSALSNGLNLKDKKPT
ncbi:DUF674 family protein [Quillaja saponaria]|uniref:DUF674 family protein n=1 Tax=Quillaja saponaria TaxID=32244 RepID=A0AAD7LNP4_QUISA|nr:DUF674 family protein [Quillaja saponaria]KAJ7961313.1 DUF674 family protein [Quillaja saponaria]